MKKMIVKMAIASAIVFMAVSCGKPEFVKDETWDVWIALNSKVNLWSLRQTAAEDMIQSAVSTIINNNDITEDERNDRLIYATCYYAWLNYLNPLDSDGHILDDDHVHFYYQEFQASDVSKKKYDEIKEIFNLDIPQDEYMYYVNANEEHLKEGSNAIFHNYGITYLQKLRDAVSVYELKKDKKRSKKGIEVYNVIYFVTAGDNSGYVRCEALINNKTDNQEMRIINTSEYLLDL